MRNRIAKWVAVLLPMALLISVGPGMSAGATSLSGVRTTCAPNGHIRAHTHYGTFYQIRNAYWLGQRPQCLSNSGHFTDFKVIQRAGFDPRGRVVAFPDIFRGCIWAICSPGSHLPRQVSTLGSTRATWHTAGNPAGTWNSAFDIWFGKRKMFTGQATGAELMIWLNRHGGCCALQPGAPKVWVDGQEWWLSHWVTSHDGHSWNYIQFRRVHRTQRTDGLRIRPFIHRVERMGLIRPQWWIENLEVGFEIWNGGQGLETTRYRVWNIIP